MHEVQFLRMNQLLKMTQVDVVESCGKSLTRVPVVYNVLLTATHTARPTRR